MGCSGSKTNHVKDDSKSKVTTRDGTTVVSGTSHEVSSQSSLSADDDHQAGGQRLQLDAGMFVQQKFSNLNERYHKVGRLGDGAFGMVWLCQDKTSGQHRAVKQVRKTDESKTVYNEVEILRQLDHPNIMKIFEFFEYKKDLYLVMECYTGGELFDQIVRRKRFTEQSAAYVMQQCLSGISYLHSKHIIHRDLKPENLLLDSKNKDALIKIVDFGLSKVLDPGKKLKQRSGSSYYMAPEVVNRNYDSKCDIWSLGVIMYILLCGYPPFNAENDAAIMEKVSMGYFSFDPTDWQTISSEAVDLLTSVLHVDPVKRLTADQCLRHEWLKKFSAVGHLQIGNQRAKKALGNMQAVRNDQKLASAALLLMGSKLTTMEETRNLAKIFRQIDQDGNGRLDRDELIAGYQLMLGENAVMEEIESNVDSILACVDYDNNGYIEFSEFVTVAMNRADLVNSERLRAAFNMFDSDGSGAIASEELRQMLGGDAVDDATWHEILNEVDENGDGEVDFEEFEAMMMKLIKKENRQRNRVRVRVQPLKTINEAEAIIEPGMDAPIESLLA